MSFSRRVLHMDFCPRFASDQPADATGYPLRHRGLRQRHRGDATHGRRRADTVATTHQLSGGCWETAIHAWNGLYGVLLRIRPRHSNVPNPKSRLRTLS
jgi:hypothetical protein